MFETLLLMAIEYGITALRALGGGGVALLRPEHTCEHFRSGDKVGVEVSWCSRTVGISPNRLPTLDCGLTWHLTSRCMVKRLRCKYIFFGKISVGRGMNRISQIIKAETKIKL